MELKDIYRPIEKELKKVEEVLECVLSKSKNESILKINRFLLESGGKRLRPALVILSTKSSQQSLSINKHSMFSIAAAMELIHIASLIHDDVIDHAYLRHSKPTINSKYGQDVSIALGDYLYSIAFELISDCGNSDILRCISSATKSMCEGELIQVCERDNLDLLKERYFLIVKKKTACLFAASCQAGAIIAGAKFSYKNILTEYGLNFGIAFQIIDDYLDLVGQEEQLGKTPGQDVKAGEMTLPILYLLESLPVGEREELKNLLTSKRDKKSLQRIRLKLFNSPAPIRTKEAVFSYLNLAKKRIEILSNSDYKRSLLGLADFIMKRGFH